MQYYHKQLTQNPLLSYYYEIRPSTPLGLLICALRRTILSFDNEFAMNMISSELFCNDYIWQKPLILAVKNRLFSITSVPILYLTKSDIITIL